MKKKVKAAPKKKPAKKKSGDKATRFAASYVNIKPHEVQMMYVAQLVEIIQTLAGSVLSQREPDA